MPQMPIFVLLFHYFFVFDHCVVAPSFQVRQLGCHRFVSVLSAIIHSVGTQIATVKGEVVRICLIHN